MGLRFPGNNHIESVVPRRSLLTEPREGVGGVLLLLVLVAQARPAEAAGLSTSQAAWAAVSMFVDSQLGLLVFGGGLTVGEIVWVGSNRKRYPRANRSSASFA